MASMGDIAEEESPSPLKKLKGLENSVPVVDSKLDEGAAVDDDDSDDGSGSWDEIEERHFSDGNSSEGMEFENDDDRKKYKEYRRQFNESDGFDVTTFPKVSFIGRVHLVNVDDPTSYNFAGCKKALELVINEHNRQKNADLELVRILKSNACCFTVYRTTFLAKSKSDEEVRTYQSEMFYSDLSGNYKSYIFREKGN
ncbi:uncharacterized protein LOC126660032 [Mercurialis annua]|uniref:uncharacterized protein LOC126660032 n=1 Tax=Mercurialis annua TaxID=3986 RepID=UPI002160C382|nr:uncharacterized protein LOC126660032 [Mercurialis annua]